MTTPRQRLLVLRAEERYNSAQHSDVNSMRTEKLRLRLVELEARYPKNPEPAVNLPQPPRRPRYEATAVIGAKKPVKGKAKKAKTYCSVSEMVVALGDKKFALRFLRSLAQREAKERRAQRKAGCCLHCGSRPLDPLERQVVETALAFHDWALVAFKQKRAVTPEVMAAARNQQTAILALKAARSKRKP